ncbi:integrase arm-type DNA-binding domain-containing protein [Hyphomicrobiales bacterium BP6-180914]|uniref:Integrase arm-type DNA-binding domain-containing protein n=1 Tax=Lichenifustis flavocetrariae TaxID=2949735 RepID=A0AA41YXV6_9HYPH|nr:integrase arm-type DNA-binding domain-containing protein [Lichenifustis flavocetrariae]
MTFPTGRAEHIVYDDDLAGFGLRMHPGGRRTWFVQYRVGQRQRRLKIGTVEQLDAEKARAQAKAMLAKVSLGIDPALETEVARTQAAVTLKRTAEDYLARHAVKRLKAGSFAEVQRHLRQHWKPLGERPLSSITRALVSARLVEIARENGPFAANRARAALSAFFSWAIGEGLAENNPVAGTNKATDEVTRDRVLSDEELILVWRCAGVGDYGAIVRMLVLSACRRDEVGGMAWSELQGNVWTIPGPRTKNGLPHDVPLSLLAAEVLAELPRRDGRDLVFGSRAGPFSGWSKAKVDLDARMLTALKAERGNKAILTPWRLHDLRRTTATRMADLGVLPHVIEAVLNHISGHRAGVAGVYNRATYAADKRAALALWAERIAKLTRTGHDVES